MKQTLRKIYKFTPLIVLGLVIIMIFQLGYAMANGEVPTIFNRAISYVPTPSMEDEIMAGDMIIVHTDVDEFKAGDIVSFNTKINGREVSITHRIQEENGLVFTARGDNNDITYEWETDVPMEDIIGLYKGQRSALIGSIYGLLFAGNINILFIIIIGVFFVIMVLEVFNIFRVIQEKKQTEEKEKMIEEAKQKLKENEDIE
jgi:signal peptidase I